MFNFFKKLRKKFIYSMIGLWIAFKEEKSLWAFLIIFPILIIFGFLLKISNIEWAIVMMIMFFSIAVEIMNTALEATIDTISFQYNVKVKKIKDIAAAATLIVSLGSVFSIMLIYLPKILEKL